VRSGSLRGWVRCYPCLAHHAVDANAITAIRWTLGVALPTLSHQALTAPPSSRHAARDLLYLRSMSKSKKRSKRFRGTTDRSATTDVVTQLECAIRNPHAAAIGAVIGGLVPWFGRTLAHEEIPSAWSGGNHGLALVMVAVVLGCACFSAISVYKFGRAAFGDSHKALGFVLALEGVMLVSHGTTSGVALAVLIAINAVANGSVIALSRDPTRRQSNADVRRAATRARNRPSPAASARSVPSPHLSAPVATAPAAARPARAARTPGQALVTPMWRRATLDDVIDAEIVSEEGLLS